MPHKNSYVTVTDQFCGAGGSSLGAASTGAEIKLALNHWALAIETHNTNFPDTYHECTDVSACDPRRYPSTDILITSPECTNHSIAKGRKRAYYQQDMFGKLLIDPSEERSRATMWDVPRFAEYHSYNCIIVENVVDARQWVMWDAWLHAMELLGYDHEVVFFNSQFAHPTPQSRDRMYVVFWKSGNRKPDLSFYPPAWCEQCSKDVGAVQTWKNAAKRFGRYGRNGQYTYNCPVCSSVLRPYYYPALNAIDWSMPIQRIGDRAKPLQERTMQRIRLGLERFANQHILTDILYSHGHDKRSHPVDGPWPTQTTQQSLALIRVPWLQPMTRDDDPRHSLVMPFVVGYNGNGGEASVGEALPTQTSLQRHAVVMPMILHQSNGTGYQSPAWPVTDPAPTMTGIVGHRVIMPEEPVSVENCGFRMLEPHEIQSAMGFPVRYVVKGNKRERVKQLGNAVTPPMMELLVERCIESLEGTIPSRPTTKIPGRNWEGWITPYEEE